MAVYGGFAPGTYEAWALNLLSDIFVTEGIARGLQVTAPGGMGLQVGLDVTSGDGVCFLPNGAWLRIDTAQSFSAPANNTGSTRTDAIVAFVDGTGVSNPSISLTYITNWATGFSGTANQFVIALISVPNGAASLTSGNITMNTAAAKITGTSSSSSNSMLASDGVGLTVQDNSATSTLSIVTTGLTAGEGRIVALVVTDVSQIGHNFLFNTDGSIAAPGSKFVLNPVAVNNETINTAMVDAVPGGSSGHIDVSMRNPSGGRFYFITQNVSAYLDINGVYSGSTTFERVIDTTNSTTSSQRIFTGTTQPTNATNGDIWIKA